MMQPSFKGLGKRLDDIDFPLVGRLIGVGEDEIHAILDVESAGTGFDKQGRPKMLFEPHIFWRQLGPGPKRDLASKQGLAYPTWKRDYPADSYPRLLRAITIDREAALRSASWGLGQIMGFNHYSAGYTSASAMVTAFLDDEEEHLRAMIKYIKTVNLDRYLRVHDWKGFARGYNGPGFAKNGYDKKLAASFAKWQKIKDTPVPAGLALMGKPVGPGKTPPIIRPKTVGFMTGAWQAFRAFRAVKEIGMDNYKSILASKTVWGGVLALAAGAAGIFGYAVSTADVTAITDIVTSVGAAIGGLIAIVGRIKATKKLG